ncbi:MAG TPA: serine/threonine-protein kinase, partial [Polyangiaceae bacterium]
MSRLDPYALVGRTFCDRYTLDAFAGIGRYSAVYRATDKETRRPVAIRLLKVRPNLSANERGAVLQRLRALVSATHDLTARCATFAAWSDAAAATTPDGRWMPGLVQSWALGETLEALVVKGGPPRSFTQTLDWMTPVADALSSAHAVGMVHGSLAARNVLTRSDSTLEILDLGLVAAMADLQSRQRAFGTPDEGPFSFFVPAYASPEQFSAASARVGLGDLGPAADVFSLALVLVELLTGRPPLGDGDDAQLESASRDPARRPTPRTRGRDLGGSVEAVFERALAVRPADRHRTVESFWTALRAASQLTLRARANTAPPALPADSPTSPEAYLVRARTPSVPSRREVLPPPPPPAPTVEPTPSVWTSPPRDSSRGRRDLEETVVPPVSPRGRISMISERWDDEALDLAVGDRIAGKYVIERLLGRGGMGSVWLCTHLGLGERVAVKVMSQKMAADLETRARFEREARASARIKSRYVARVYDTGELPGERPFFVMEYMEGETLSQVLQRVTTLPLPEVVRILAQVGRGVARAHELGIVHRDIKPDNVFLAHTADDGMLAKVFDFGIVKEVDTPNDGATREGVLLGTPHYMSPEQADGLPLDQRSDIYALGVLAFRMLTGKRPFQADSVLAVLVKICSAPLPSLAENAPFIPPAVEAWYRKACARDPKARFGSAIECVEALANAAGVAALEGPRDVSILPPPPPARAGGVEAETVSCPTLLDDLSGVMDDDDGELWADASEGASSDPAPPSNMNPLFGGERSSVVPERSVAPLALERKRSARPPAKGRRARRASAVLAAGAMAVGLAVL